MKKEMLINVLQPEECRIAIVEDGILEELYVERTSHESYTGNIYKGKIVNLEPAIQAAFVDFSVGRNGFLHVSDVEPQYYRKKEGDESEPAPRDPRRERPGDRDRGRRGRSGPPSPEDREPLPPPPSYPEDRPPRPPERERPDRSEKGRRDRTERRFGEGLVGDEDWSPPASRPVEPILPPTTRREREPEPERFEREEPVSRRRSEVPPPPRSAEPPPFVPPRAVEPPPYLPPRPPEPEEPRARVARPPHDTTEADLPPSRTNRQRTHVPPPRPPVEPPGEVRARAVPPSVPRPRPPVEDEPPRARPTPSRPMPIEPEPPTDADLASGREPRRGRGGRGRSPRPDAAPEARFAPEPSSPPHVEPPFFEEAAPEPIFEDRAEPPRRRGGRDAIRNRGGDRDPAPPRDRVRPTPEERVIEPEFDRPRAPESERPRAPEPERPRALEPERPRTIEPDRDPIPERRRGAEAERPPRDREGSRPIDRAGEEGYVPRRMRSRPGESLFDTESAPASWAEPEDERDEDLEEGAETEGGEGDADRPPGTRRRRRRRRRREGERPTRESIAKGPAGDIEDLDDLEADETVAPLAEDEVPDVDDFDFGDEPHARGRHDVDLDDDEIEDDEDEEVVARGVVNPEDEIDPELEEEIRKEIEEIAELEREMGLRGTVEARPRRGDEPAEADGGRGGRSPRGRGLIKPPIQDIFRRGDEVLIQVIKESIGTKGPTLSTYISIPGRYLVLMPGLNRVGVSRKIADESQRRKLREIMNDLNPPKGLGFIVRTAGLDRSKRDLARDLAYLLRLWKVILRRIKKAKGPMPIYQESDMITRTIRDIFNAEIDTIWIDEPAAFERAQEFLRVVMPRFVTRLKLYDEKVPLFHKYGIEEEIAKIQRRRVEMPEGGSIVIDQTEALVAIDVNSGNFRVENDAERTAYEMNLRAAKEIARQLRLRDLGGVIVNDFIDMREEKNRRGVEKALRDAIKRDRARTKVLRMSQFGLIEMTRQRIRPSLKRSVYEDCRHCNGLGVVKTVESMSIDVMRLLALASHREEVRRVNVGVSPAVAVYLNNRKRRELTRFEVDANLTIHIRHEDDAPPEHLQFECFDANNNEIRVLPQPAPTHRRGR
jgi:ribonuclease E